LDGCNSQEADLISAPDQMVTFRIGQGDDFQIFLIHKEFACRHSRVFDKAFNSDFIEGRTQTYTLKDVTPEVFRFISQWLYQEKITLAVHDEREPEEPDDHHHHWGKCSAQDLLLVELWILADRFCIESLQNVIIDNMLRIQRECGPMDFPCYLRIYEGTERGSTLRRFAVDQVACLSQPKRIVGNLAIYPHVMHVDLVTKRVTKQAPVHQFESMKAHYYYAERFEP
jgi:hypothetical protein